MTGVTQGDREAALPIMRHLYVKPDDGAAEISFFEGNIKKGEYDQHYISQAFAAHRIAALEEAAKVCDMRSRQHEESFRKEAILKNQDKQTHYASRYREAEELRDEIRALKGDSA